MMFVVFLVIVAAVTSAEGSPFKAKPSLMAYHEPQGIPALERLRRQEQGRDFDGARIVGGPPVPAGTHPHLGGVFINLRDGRTSLCGSSLLTNTRAVTAAHCWYDGEVQAVQFTMVYGSSFLFTGGFRIPTSQVVMHQNWRPKVSAENDIAIVTHIWVSFTNVINRIHLPSGSLLDETFAGTYAVVAGFGRTRDDVTTPAPNPDKRHVSLLVMTNAACAQYYDEQTHVLPSVLCTSGAGGRNICAGDSGGPLAVGSGSSRVLIGVASFGLPYCTAGWPAGFTRVTSFLSWISARI